MREIKFRAWDKKNEYMFQVFDSTTQVDWFLSSWKDRYEVMQYTGLKDKNDKEIYEGDIVKCIEVSESFTREYLSEVFFEDGSWLVHESEMCDVYLYLYDNSNQTKVPLTEIEVIGNIYENLELIIRR